jgi:hypothetical protein
MSSITRRVAREDPMMFSIWWLVAALMLGGSLGFFLAAVLMLAAQAEDRVPAPQPRRFSG